MLALRGRGMRWAGERRGGWGGRLGHVTRERRWMCGACRTFWSSGTRTSWGPALLFRCGGAGAKNRISTTANRSAIKEGSKNQHYHHNHDAHDGHSHSIFRPHVHSPSDNIGLRSALSGKDSAAKITLIGLYSDVALTILKGFAGYWLHSASLMADAGHSLTDTTAGMITLASLKLSQRGTKEVNGEMEDRWPYGLGKVETFGSLAMGLMLIGAAGGIGIHSIHLIQDLLSNGHSLLTETAHAHGIDSLFGSSHDHHHVAEAGHHMDPRAIYFALLSIIVKEALYRVTRKVGTRISSPVVLANAQHHRIDALTSGVTLLAVAGSYFGLPILDPLGGVLVSLMIGRAGWTITYDACRELCDVGLDRKMTKKVKDDILSFGLQDVQEVRQVQGHKSGQFLILDISLQVAQDMTISRWNAIDLNLQKNLKHALAPHQVRQIRIKPLPEPTSTKP